MKDDITDCDITLLIDILLYISIRFYSPFNCCNKCVVYVTFVIVASSFSVGLVFIKSPQYKETKSSFPI